MYGRRGLLLCGLSDILVLPTGCAMRCQQASKERREIESEKDANESSVTPDKRRISADYHTTENG